MRNYGWDQMSVSTETGIESEKYLTMVQCD